MNIELLSSLKATHLRSTYRPLKRGRERENDHYYQSTFIPPWKQSSTDLTHHLTCSLATITLRLHPHPCTITIIHKPYSSSHMLPCSNHPQITPSSLRYHNHPQTILTISHVPLLQSPTDYTLIPVVSSQPSTDPTHHLACSLAPITRRFNSQIMPYHLIITKYRNVTIHDQYNSLYSFRSSSASSSHTLITKLLHPHVTPSPYMCITPSQQQCFITLTAKLLHPQVMLSPYVHHTFTTTFHHSHHKITSPTRNAFSLCASHLHHNNASSLSPHHTPTRTTTSVTNSQAMIAK